MIPLCALPVNIKDNANRPANVDIVVALPPSNNVVDRHQQRSLGARTVLTLRSFSHQVVSSLTTTQPPAPCLVSPFPFAVPLRHDRSYQPLLNHGKPLQYHWSSRRQLQSRHQPQTQGALVASHRDSYSTASTALRLRFATSSSRSNLDRPNTTSQPHHQRLPTTLQQDLRQQFE